MIGIIPSNTKTFEVFGYFDSSNLVEGKLYIDSVDNRVYVYSLTKTRSNPDTGYFPVWDGKHKYISQFSNKKFFEDVIITDISEMSANIGKNVANQILYQQRKSVNDEILSPSASDGDNMFTQCIKGILNVKQLTLVDLVDMSNPQLSEKLIENYYSALTKITFMRLDKWDIWMGIILHMTYILTVYKDNEKLLSYDSKQNLFDVDIVKYDKIINTKDDPFKKIIKILIEMNGINKNSLRSKEVDDYTINNMLTTLGGNKPISSQLFSRFIRIANLSYDVKIFEGDNVIFEYREF